MIRPFWDRIHPLGLRHLPEDSAQRGPSLVICLDGTASSSAASGGASPEQQAGCIDCVTVAGFSDIVSKTQLPVAGSFHLQPILDMGIQGKTGAGSERAWRPLAPSATPFIPKQHTPEIVTFSAPLPYFCFSSPYPKNKCLPEPRKLSS